MNQNTTGQMPYRLVKQVRGNEVLRKSFMELAMKTFSLNFRRWCEDGYWTERYIPYVLADGDRVIANVSVNRMDMLWRGQAKQYIQIGTVMTDEAYRGKGLSKFLIETVLHDWKDRCDAIYLFANRTVLDFYPKFGFVKAVEHQQSFSLAPQPGDFQKLDMQNERHRQLLLDCYHLANPYSQFQMVSNDGLLMFYCTGFMKDCVFYSQQHNAVVVAQQEGDALYCHDVFGTPRISLQNLLAQAAGEQTRRVILGFSATEDLGRLEAVCEEDDKLFVYGAKENLFCQEKIMFPFLSHA